MLETSAKAYLILENGTIFKGRAFGYSKEVTGELVFTTSVVGHQETISDPSYGGQLLMMTFPLIGNAGLNLEDMEAAHPRLRGLIVREKCDKPSNWRCELEMDGFMKQHKITGIEGIDTRALMRMLRDHGSMKAMITTRSPEGENPQLTKDQIQQKLTGINNHNAVREATCQIPYTIEGTGKTMHVAVLDLGINNGSLEELKRRGMRITVYPAYTDPAVIMQSNADGVFISGGPGSPLDIPEIVENVKKLIAWKPVFGIGLGHQVIAQAMGCAVSRMKCGHHGSNYPVKDLQSGKVYITNQNTDYTVSQSPEDVIVTFRNVNDGATEGIAHRTKPVFSVQFRPETASNPCHTGFVYDQFQTLMEGGKLNA